MKRSTAPAALAVLAAMLAAAPATAAPAADAPVSTNPAVADPTAAQISDWIAAGEAQPAPLNAGSSDEGFLAPERRIHGEVGAGVSNRGYGGYAAVQMPLGQASEVDVAVAGDHYDYGRWGRGDTKSISVALLLDGNDLKNLISRRKCNVPRWGVKLHDDPVVLPDGSCLKREDKTASRDTLSQPFR